MPALRFTVPGKPVPKGRPRFWQGRTLTPKGTREYERHVMSCALAAMNVRGPWVTIAGPVAVTLRVFWPDARHRDLDNMAKVVDALNGAVWVDDSQIVEWHIYGAIDRVNPRLEIEIEERT